MLARPVLGALHWLACLCVRLIDGLIAFANLFSSASLLPGLRRRIQGIGVRGTGIGSVVAWE